MNELNPLANRLPVSVSTPVHRTVANEEPAVLPADLFAGSAPATPDSPPKPAPSDAPQPTPTEPPAPAPPPVPTTLALDPTETPVKSGEPGPPPPSGNLGPGFPSAKASDRSLAEKIHGFLAKDPTGAYDTAIELILDRVSGVTRKGIGVDVSGLLTVERMMFKTLAGGLESYQGNVPPLFQALAEGQAAYVNLGPERQDDADHLMRMFSGLPLDMIESLDDQSELSKIRKLLVEKARNKEFPAYIDTDGKFEEVTPTESITTESIASIARRENSLGSDFPDPRLYYKWLVTRVESNYKRLDPWLFAANHKVHEQINVIKENLTPPWLKDRNDNDPFGSQPLRRNVQKAYREMMSVCGNGQAPTWQTLTDVADTVVGLDRDLLSGIQTYWVKLLSEVGTDQRESLMAPVSRAWVNLNVVGPEDPKFETVSPSNSPMIELVDRHTGNVVRGRYDRSLALGQGVDHMLAGLGIKERRDFLKVLMKDIREHQPDLEAREQRLRQQLGDKYSGLDVNAILNDRQTIHSSEVKQALRELREAAAAYGPEPQMTPEYAEIVRHRDLMDWVASRYSRYGDLAFDQLFDSCRDQADFGENPLILSEYYEPQPTPESGVTPLPAGPRRADVLGKTTGGKEPIKASMVLEGGGGKGFAFVEVLRQVRGALSQGDQPVAIDEYVGNSAGAITAGMLAAGYSGDELAKVLEELDFKKFYSDYLWLSGGVDPKVRGINRTGLFSMQKMYKTLSELLKRKTGVEGRPVLFRDLPFKLRVTSTVLNADVNDHMKKKLDIAPDGQVVFSNENAPNMDVAAALCCSAAVPGFFNAPQLQLCQQDGGYGEDHKLHRMQLVDGGVVNNFPVAEASKDEKSFLLTLPAHFEAPNPNGGPPIALSTLNFDSKNIGEINKYNAEQYKKINPGLPKAIAAAAEAGYGRVVFGLNLTDMKTQTAPIVQGRNRAETLRLQAKASELGLPTMDAHAGAEVVKGNLEGKEHGFWEQRLLNTLLDKNNAFSPKGIFGGDPEYRYQVDEAEGLPEMLAGVMGASMTAPSQLEHRLFEQA